MEQTVYIDLLFLINFSMDFLCFFLASRILSWRISLPRTLMAAVVGGIYSSAALFLPKLYFLSFVIDVAVSFFMVLIVTLGRRFADIILSWVVFFAVSMALGGFMTAIFNLLNKAGLGGADPSGEEGISVWLFLLIALVSGAITLFSGRFFRKKAATRTARVTVSYCGRSIVLEGLVDSGNFLREPISARLCVVADRGVLSGFLPSELLSASGNAVHIDILSPEHAKSVRLVPTRSATGEGVLLAIRPDKMYIDVGKGEVSVDAMLAISTLGGGERSALVPAELIE